MSRREEPGYFDSLNYFICTLGQAAEFNSHHPHSFSTVNELLDYQEREVPNLPAVGFFLPSRTKTEELEYRVLTFAELARGSKFVARHLSHNVLPLFGCLEQRPPTVAMLYSSPYEFMLLWLGLTRLGLSSLHLAPQLQPDAILHLLRECKVEKLLYEDGYEQTAKAVYALHQSSAPGSVELELISGSLDDSRSDILDRIRAQKAPPVDVDWSCTEADELYVHHSSGTSGGAPKPICQSHKGAVAGLPYLPKGKEEATFSTTPLYHAGISDCFRAWTSCAMIWLFPIKHRPITPSNIEECLKIASEAQQASSDSVLPQIKYFSSVPFILQMMAEDKKALASLQQMDLVGVGGAAMPNSVGNDLVSKGVNLVSRFGNVESGFLLSSQRDFSKDSAWHYLRSKSGSQFLRFEPRSDDTFELIVLPGWPQMNKVNRTDGAFATADLFEPHPTIPQAWKYHSRADSQITLVTGKKFDPTPIESSLSSSPYIRNSFVTGEGQHAAGAIILRTGKAGSKSEAEFLDLIRTDIDAANRKSPSHAKLTKHFITSLGPEEQDLEKSSKGTVMRGKMIKRFEGLISSLYSGSGSKQTEDKTQTRNVPDEEILKYISSHVSGVLDIDGSIDVNADLYALGIDSAAALNIRSRVQDLLPSDEDTLPLNIVYDTGTVQTLSEYIQRRRHGVQGKSYDELEFMPRLVDKYGDFKDNKHMAMYELPEGTTSQRHEVVVLTGATGALGAHVLDLLRHDNNVAQIVCLVRGRDEYAARERVNKSLLSRKKSCLDPKDSKVIISVTRIGDDDLGLGTAMARDLSQRVTSIIHAAWTVNFSLRLQSFEKDHLAGLRNLISFAISDKHRTPPSLIFCSSTACVAQSNTPGPILESVSLDPAAASPLGYSRSKWVAEGICRRAHDTTRLIGRIGIVRIGQLCGDTTHGIWNTSEAWPLLLSSAKVTGSLPDLNEPLSWLPVDIAAQAVIQISNFLRLPRENTEIPVFHTLNDRKDATWHDLLSWLRSMDVNFQTLDARNWVAALETSVKNGIQHPAFRLLGLWKNAYAPQDSEKASKSRTDVSFSMDQARNAAPVLNGMQPLDKQHFQRMYRWIEEAITV